MQRDAFDWMAIPIMLLPFLFTACSTATPDSSDLSRSARQHLIQEIQSTSGYRQIRAAETLGEPQPGFPIDSAEAAVRIGQLRIRVAAGQREYAKEIIQTALNPAAPGHVHAIEAAAKLRLQLSKAERDTLRTLMSDPEAPATGFALWVLAENEDSEADATITDILVGKHLGSSLIAAYAAGFLNRLPPAREKALRDMVADGNPLQSAFAMLALARHRRVGSDNIHRRLEQLPQNADEKITRFLLTSLAEVGGRHDLPTLAVYLESEEPELANAAAGAILAIKRREDVRK